MTLLAHDPFTRPGSVPESRPVASAIKETLGALLRGVGLPAAMHRGRVLVLCYHRVLPADRLHEFAVEPGMYVTDATFRRHLRYLRQDYEVLSMQEWAAAWDGAGLSPKGRYCLVTFDDGWRDNYEVAFPILRELAVPATIFLATGFVGTGEWFWTEKLTFLLARGDLRRIGDGPPGAGPAWAPIRALAAQHPPAGTGRLHAVSAAIQALKAHPATELEVLCADLILRLELPLPATRICMNWGEVQQMAAANMGFGSHSRNHELLPSLPTAQVRAELTSSRADLAAHGVAVSPVFCYPNGSFDSRTRALVRDAGYAGAVSTRPGLETLAPRDRFAIHRVAVHDDISRTPELLAAHLMAASARPGAALAALGARTMRFGGENGRFCPVGVPGPGEMPGAGR